MSVIKIRPLAILVANLILSCNLQAQIAFRPDFPSVLVPGANVTGGRDNSATNLVVDTILTNPLTSWAESVPGGTYPGYTRCNMRYALEDATGPRNVIVAVAGYEIYPYGGDNGLIITEGDLTVWGQTAPGRYIVRNTGWTFRQGSSNTIVEHITFMIGDSVQSLSGDQRVFNNEAHGIIVQMQSGATVDIVGMVFSHNTFLYGIDSNVDVFNSNPDTRKIDSLLFWRNLAACAIDIPTNQEAEDFYGYPNPPGYSDQAKDNHSYNFAIGMSYTEIDVVDDTKGNKAIVLLENILAHTDARNPLSNCNLTLANNVIYNPDNRGTYLRNEGPCADPDYVPPCLEEDNPVPTTSDILFNHYKAGPLTGGGISMVPVFFGEGVASDDTLVTGSRVYMAGNRDDWSQVRFYEDGVEATTPHVSGVVQNEVFDIALRGADHLVGFLVPRVGANYRYRTVNETKIFDDVTNGTLDVSSSDTLTMVKSLTNTNMPNYGGFPSVTYTKRVFTDLPANPNGDGDADGYSNLEEYIHNYTLNAEYQLNTILHGSYEMQRYPWMHDTFTQLERRLAKR